MNENEMGSFIAQRRKDLGLTQAQLAERLHAWRLGPNKKASLTAGFFC